MVEAQDAVGPPPAGRLHGLRHRRQVARVSQSLGTDDDPCGPAGNGAAGVVRRRHASVEPDRQAEPGDRPDDRAMVAGAGDGVEVRHVARIRAEALTERPGERDGIRRGGEHALDRPVGVALAAHRVHGHAALEIEHRYDAHRREDSTRHRPTQAKGRQ